jgi:hypothetical protein
MKEWLPGGFEPQAMDERIARTLAAVRRRNARRNKALRAAKWAAGAAAVLAVAFFFAPKVNRQEVSSPNGIAQRAAGVGRDRAREPGSQGARVGEDIKPVEAASAPAASSKVVPSSPTRLLAFSPTRESPGVTLSKSPKGVELKWQGEPGKDYVVYRCTSPRFDTCSRAAEVKGTKWTDREADDAPLVFYKVEPKDKG